MSELRPWKLAPLACLVASAWQGCFAALCDESWRQDECPKFCTGTLEGKCCAHAGRTASILTVPSPSHAMAVERRTEWYRNCTGADIQTPLYVPQCVGSAANYCGGFRALFEIGLGAREDAKGAGIYDGYMTQAMDLAAFGDTIEDLRPRISESLELQWSDILPYVRRSNMVGDKQAALPFDFDFINVLLRDDLVAEYFAQTGRTAPQTWEQFAEFVEHWNGKDLNGDGEADYGLCSLNGAGPGGPQALLMAIAATKLQYLGASQGMWFETDTKTATPLLDNPGFRQALELTRRLWMASLDRSAGGWVYLHETAWLTGRCSAYVWLTGSAAFVLTYSPIQRVDANGTVLWRPEGPGGKYVEPRRVLPMGSTEVYDRDSGEMRKCTPSQPPAEGEVVCPFLNPVTDEQNGNWINRVPYYYSAYQHSSVSIRSAAPEEKKDLLWDFLVFANREAGAVVAQQLGSTYLDPFRRSQIKVDSKSEYSGAWTAQMYADMRDVFLWAGSSPNSGLPLSIPGREDYEYAMEQYLWQYFLDVAPCSSHIECKCNKWVGGKDANPDCGYGWGTAPDTALWERADREGRGSITTDQFISSLSKEYDMITARHGGPGAEGKLKQINLYRQTIGLEAFAPESLVSTIMERSDQTLLLALVISVGVLFSAIIIFAVVSFARYLRRLVKNRRDFQQLIEQRTQEKLRMGIEAVAHCQYPMVVMSAGHFVTMDQLDVSDLRHEGNRDRGNMLFLDTIPRVAEFKAQGKRIIFMSYECLSFAQAGPDSVQFAAMKRAAAELAEECGEPDLSKWYIWLDVLSIPQEHPGLREMAINSLYTYASQADQFVIVAPTSRHADREQLADKDTYKNRVFCRAEQVAHYCHQGLDTMHIMGDDGLEPVSEGWIQDIICVFDGEMTCCRLRHPKGWTCDREKLVPPLLGLFFDVCLDCHGEEFPGPAKGSAWKTITASKDVVFPRQYDCTLEDGKVERRELFGEMIERAAVMVDKDLDGCRRHLHDTKHRLLESVRTSKRANTLYLAPVDKILSMAQTRVDASLGTMHTSLQTSVDARTHQPSGCGSSDTTHHMSEPSTSDIDIDIDIDARKPCPPRNWRGDTGIHK